ncbi:hypothetical protein CAC42_4336 [Sphaceloma murrayae]|uniref:Uncharacterized protein n=1 Tax=Sphaceloma murrayae TaxID=2082308 RepID=A0A2K1QLA0_9PEZI|nr:hypothetical protein CAC42_4336 [Sphaceloma murrayae]
MGLLVEVAQQLLENAKRFEAEFAEEQPHLWEARPFDALDDVRGLPSHAASELMEKIRLDCRAMQSIVTPSRYKLLDVAMSQLTASALNVAASLDIADAIASEGGNASLSRLAEILDVNENKLGTADESSR